MGTKGRLGKRVARGPKALGVFKDHETDWVFNRTLSYINEKGAEIGECLFAARRIKENNAESWIWEWSALADKIREMADKALLEGHIVSARECFLRASNYYRTAEYGCTPSHPQFHELWEKSVNSFHHACPLFNPPIQIIKVPFEDKELPGYFWRPGESETKRPTLFTVGGGDSSGEEVFFGGGPAAVRRGYNFFTFEFPGHRGTVHLYPDCVRQPDYEVPFKDAFDYLETLPGVDDRIALTGFSFGGYVVSRVAAYEKRVKAVIPNSPIINIHELGKKLFQMILDTKIPLWLVKHLATWKMNKMPLTKSLTEYAVWSMGYDFSKIWIKEELEKMIQNNKRFIIKDDEINKITCPTLVLVSEDEGEFLQQQAWKFYEGISSTEKKIHIFSLEKDGTIDHCQFDSRSRGNQVMFDWLDDLFNYRGTKAEPV